MAWTSLDRIALRIGNTLFADLDTNAKQRLVQLTEAVEQVLSLPPWNFRLASGTITEYLPRHTSVIDQVDLSDYENQNSKIVPVNRDRGSIVLQLSHTPVLLSGLVIYEDLDAYAGQGAGAFGSGTLLTEGTDYYLDADEPGISSSGKVYRIGSTWPTQARSIKATYKGGQAAQVAAGLGVDFNNVFEEVVTACVLHNYSFHEQQISSYASGMNGQVQTSESLGKYSRGYGAAQGSISGAPFQFGATPELVPAELCVALSPYVNVGALLAR